MWADIEISIARSQPSTFAYSQKKWVNRPANEQMTMSIQYSGPSVKLRLDFRMRWIWETVPPQMDRRKVVRNGKTERNRSMNSFACFSGISKVPGRVCVLRFDVWLILDTRCRPPCSTSKIHPQHQQIHLCSPTEATWKFVSCHYQR